MSRRGTQRSVPLGHFWESVTGSSYPLLHFLAPLKPISLNSRAKPTEVLGGPWRKCVPHTQHTPAPCTDPHPVPLPNQGPWAEQLPAFPMGKAGVTCRWAGPMPTSGGCQNLPSEPPHPLQAPFLSCPPWHLYLPEDLSFHHCSALPSCPYSR